MRGLSEIVADNAAIEKQLAARRKASLRRLKQRIANMLHGAESVVWIRSAVNQAIDAWDAAERKRGLR